MSLTPPESDPASATRPLLADAGALDLSRLAPFTLVSGDYETDLASLKAGVIARCAARGVNLDTLDLESEPITALLEEVAYRRSLERAAVNDAGKALTLAYAWGAGLDHIAATHFADIGIRRAEGESDDRFRRRILLAAQARTAGTLEGYEYAALTVAPELADARALNHASGLVRPGQIAVILLPAAGAAPSAEAELLERVTDALFHRSVKHGSDDLTVRLATRVIFDVSAVLEVRRGPDPALVRATALQALQAYAADRRRIGAPIAESGVHAALHVGGVERVRLLGWTSPTVPADGAPQLGEAFLATEQANG